MSQAGLVEIESSHPQIPTSFVTNSGTAVPILNILEILATTVAAHGIPLETLGSGNTVTIEAQYASANASSDATKAGFSSFNSTFFTVDDNGYVSFNGSGVGETITGNIGGALSPVSGNWNIFGTSTAAGTTPVETSGSGNTLTIQVQKSQAIASTNASNIGLSAFNSTQFTVDENGFVSLSGSDVGQTITGNTGGAISPVAGNWNLLTANSTVKFAGTTGTETLDFGLSNLLLGSSGSAITSGTRLTGLGMSVLNSMTSGFDNVAIGYQAMISSLASSNQNTVVGSQSGTSLSGSGNTIVGFQSGVSLNSQNCILGEDAAGTCTGVSNILIGNSAGSFLNTTESSNIYISHQGVIGESNTIRIGTQGTGLGQQNICYLAGVLNTVSGQVVKINTPGLYPYTTLITDYVILVNTSSARTINLISSPVTGTTYRIKDNTGSAAVNNITVTPAAGNIDGSASATINTNYGSIDVCYNGSMWVIL